MNVEALPATVLPEISIIQQERHEAGPYFWDNAARTHSRDVVLQQTLAGSVTFWWPGGAMQVPEGFAMLFRYGEPTSYGLDEESALPYELRWALLPDVPAVASIYSEIVRRFGPVVRMDKKREASKLFARFSAARQSGRGGDRFLEAEAVFRLLVAVYREQFASPGDGDAVALGRHLIETEFRTGRNVKEIAGEIGISRGHFTREFAARYGESPAAYQRRLRLGYAEQLLANPFLEQREIAAASGFGSMRTFREAFVRAHGRTPGSGR